MSERPLVLFAQPSEVDKERRYGGGSKFFKPTYDRQRARIAPKFAVLQHALEQGNVRMSSASDAIEPEYTLVFETVGDPDGFYGAINRLKSDYPNVEWVMELSDNCPNDDDFYCLDSNDERDDDKELSTKIFCVLTNQEALSQILSLWNGYNNSEQFHFDRGLTGFKHLFDTLKDVHQWGVQERIDDTGILDDWTFELQDDSLGYVNAQIELFYRSSELKQQQAESKIRQIVDNAGGTVLCSSLINEIQYHAVLAKIPREYAERIIKKEGVELVLADEIMFLKSSGQTLGIENGELSEEEIDVSMPELIHDEPIIALFDGMPQENHPLLNDLLKVDDPDNISSTYSVNDRIHGTSMSSLILRGENMNIINNEIHRLYVRPIMKAQRDFHDNVEEYIPNDFLIVDKIHECVRRLYESEAGRVAPSVRIINLSIGISYREYYNMISPLARLLDWLSYKYRVLFIVSAGNHPDDINLGMNFSDYVRLSFEEKNKFVFNYMSSNLKNHRLLSPAESMNSLTIGASFNDNNDSTPPPNMTELCSNNMPSLYGSFGRGINSSIKPEFLYNGGRSFIRSDPSNQSVAKWVYSNSRKPGIKSAFPSEVKVELGSVGYSYGTSNSAALVSNKAGECYTILNDVFTSETGYPIPYEYSAIILKAMLAHGSAWSDLKDICTESLELSGNTTKNNIHKYIGYGIADIEKVKECTKNQVTLIGYGEIKQDQAFMYSIPLPFNFHTQKLSRKLTVTLAYFSPIKPSTMKYREKQVWFTLNDGKNIVGQRDEYDYHAVQRGTLQHEIFVTNEIAVWDENDSLTIKVNCRGDASSTNADVPIPYAIFATFEMAPEYEIDVYQKVVDRIHIKDAILPTV